MIQLYLCSGQGGLSECARELQALSPAALGLNYCYYLLARGATGKLTVTWWDLERELASFLLA